MNADQIHMSLTSIPTDWHTPPEWYWKVWFRPWVYRVCAIFFALLSLVIVWCEVTFSSHKVTLSVLALLVHVWHDVGNYIAVEVSPVLLYNSVFLTCITLYF